MRNKKSLTARFYVGGFEKKTIIDCDRLWKDFDRWREHYNIFSWIGFKNNARKNWVSNPIREHLILRFQQIRFQKLRCWKMIKASSSFLPMPHFVPGRPFLSQ